MKKFSLALVLLLVAQNWLFAQDTLPAPTSYRVNKVSFNMVRIEKGSFWMGAQHMDTAEFNYDRASLLDELPVHHVVIQNDFYLGQTEGKSGHVDILGDEKVIGEAISFIEENVR